MKRIFTFVKKQMMDRLWVFQSNRPFTKIETEKISDIITCYLSQWNAHGIALTNGFTIHYDQFIVIHVDETQTQASGCSIDDMMRMIKKMEQDLNLSLLNRMEIAYKEDEKIQTVSLQEFKKMISEGKITSETILFNNAVSSMKEFNSSWEVPVKDSWAKTWLN